MPMLAIVELAKKARNIFAKAIELLKLKFAKKHLAAVFFAVLIFVGIGLIIPQGVAHGIWGLDAVGDWLMRNVLFRIVYAIFYVLFYAAYAISWIGAATLNVNLNPEIMTQVLKSSAITDGWAVFRDIANLFFILILLFIAIGTIVRSQSYNLKNLLPKLIIAVFLINFSAVIAKVIIDFGNIFMYGVLKWMSCPGKEECFTDFFSSLMTTVRVFWDRYQLKDILFPTVQDTIGLVIATIYTFLYGLILVALGTFLMIRIAAFAILIILSPLAFVGEVFPGMKELSSEWWKNLINYTLFGPIFALLLYVSGLMARTVIDAPVTDSFYTDPALGTFGTLYATIIQNIIPLIFLLAIIPITRKLGMYGADAVFSTSVGFGTAGARFAGGAIDRYMARGAQPGYGKARKVLSYISPGAWKRAIKAHNTEAERDYDVAAGRVREKVVQPATDYLQKSTVKYADLAYQKQVAEARSESRSYDDKFKKVYLLKECFEKDENGERNGPIRPGMAGRAQGFFEDLAITSDTNDAFTDMKDENGHYFLDTREGFRGMIKKFEKALGPEKAREIGANCANLEKKDGNMSFKFMYNLNPKTGKYEEEKNEDVLNKKIGVELGTLDAQSWAKNINNRTFVNPKYKRDEHGNVLYHTEGKNKDKPIIEQKDGQDMYELAGQFKEEMNNFTGAQLDNAWKMKPKDRAKLLSALDNEEEMAKAKLTGEAKTKAERFRKALHKKDVEAVGAEGAEWGEDQTAGTWGRIISASGRSKRGGRQTTPPRSVSGGSQETDEEFIRQKESAKGKKRQEADSNDKSSDNNDNRGRDNNDQVAEKLDELVKEAKKQTRATESSKVNLEDLKTSVAKSGTGQKDGVEGFKKVIERQGKETEINASQREKIRREEEKEKKKNNDIDE